MLTLEEICALYGDPVRVRPYAFGLRYPYSLATDRRLCIARGEQGVLEVFLRGSLQSFGDVPCSGGIDWGHYHEPGGELFEALRFSLGDGEGNRRLISHFVYECVRLLALNPEVPNDALLRDLGPYVALIQDQYLLSTREQQGLFGELLFLNRLLDVCVTYGLPMENALASWRAPERSASRDFSRNGIVVEVKSTGRAVREHRISSLHQLERGVGESSLLLYSLSVSPDASSDVRLCDLIIDQRERLGSHGETYDRLLRDRGYDSRLFSAYRLAIGFSTTRFPVAIYDVDRAMPRLRTSDFSGGGVPANVSDVTYTLNLHAFRSVDNPLSPGESGRLLCRLLQ